MADSDQIDELLASWAKRVPVDQIPRVLVFLAGRLLAECGLSSRDEHGSRETPEALLTASDLAEQLHVPESWVRSEERAGRIPSIRLGKYVRFKRIEVERVLAEKTG